MPKSIAPVEVLALLKPGMTVYVPGLAGESAVLVAALRAAPAACAGVRFIGVWLPRINRVDYAGLHPEARATAFFVTRDMAASFTAGRIDFRPLSYFETFRFLRDRMSVDLAVLHTAPPNAEGRLSLGIANDFTPAIVAKARTKVAFVNPRMPQTRGAAMVALSDIDYLVDADAPLLADDDTIDPTFDAIGRHVAALIDGRGVGAVGGLVDFVRGARASPGGRAIVALPATAKSGTVSKIVALFPAGTPVGVTRSDIDVVVTEYGVAELRDKSIDERAAALIAVAAPQFRDDLARAWTQLRVLM